MNEFTLNLKLSRGYMAQSVSLARLFLVLLSVTAINASVASGVTQGARLSLEEVVRMVQSGESEEAVVNRIRLAKRSFNLTDAEKSELRQLQVTDTIIKYLVNPELPYTPTPRPAADRTPPPPESIYVNDPLAAKVPSGIGAYLLLKSDLVPIEVKSLLPEKQGGIFVKVLPGMSQKVIGVLPGVASRVRVETTPAVFYLRLAENVKIEDVTLVALDIVSKEKRRQVEFSPAEDKGGKPAVKTASIRQTDRVAVGPRLYRVATTMLGTGEFMFYVVGSADPAAAIQGKGYDFGVN